jgi:hypothetical protein
VERYVNRQCCKLELHRCCCRALYGFSDFVNPLLLLSVCVEITEPVNTAENATSGRLRRKIAMQRATLRVAPTCLQPLTASKILDAVSHAIRLLRSRFAHNEVAEASARHRVLVRKDSSHGRARASHIARGVQRRHHHEGVAVNQGAACRMAITPRSFSRAPAPSRGRARLDQLQWFTLRQERPPLPHTHPKSHQWYLASTGSPVSPVTRTAHPRLRSSSDSEHPRPSSNPPCVG